MAQIHCQAMHFWRHKLIASANELAAPIFPIERLESAGVAPHDGGGVS